MKFAYALILACLPVLSGCDEQPQSKPPGVVERYGNIPAGSRIILRLHRGGYDGSSTERGTPLLRATGRGEFEGTLVSVNEDGIVIQPNFSRSQVFFGATVVHDLQVIEPAGQDGQVSAVGR